MSNEYLEKMSELEVEFTEEVRGYGSLAIVLSPSSDGDSDGGFIGYDIRPEDIEALYFDGIGTPRWESIKADSVKEQMKVYNDTMEKIMSDYPLINRVSDTDKQINYSAEEVLQLKAECEQVLANASEPKAKRASHKFLVACHKAADKKMGLQLTPN